MSNVNSNNTPVNRSGKKRHLNPVFIIGALFFVFGFVTWLNSVLIPYLRLACQLNNFESYLVAFAFYISYLVMAIPSSWVLKATGYKKGMAAGLMMMAAGALIFVPAATTRIYGLFLLGLFIQGTGLAILQTASNPYITILGPIQSAARRISIMGICNKIAGAIAPLVLGVIALKNTDGLKDRIVHMDERQKSVVLNELSSRVIMPYIIIVIVLMVLSAIIYYSGLPEIDTEQEGETIATTHPNKTSIFQFPHLLAGVLTLFLYTGAEVMAGDTIISYGTSQGIALSTAKFFTTCTLSGMIIGYIIGIFCIPKYFTQENALKFSAVAGVVFTAVALMTHGYISVLFIALLGLANSLMWPAIWPLAIAGLGRFTKIGSSLMIMAISGAALIPLLYGKLADLLNPHLAYCILIPCYIYIGYYAVSGHKINYRVRT